MHNLLTIGRTASFLITLLSTLPLFANYLMHTEPKHQMVVHIHVWFGCMFFVFAIISMVVQKMGHRTKG